MPRALTFATRQDIIQRYTRGQSLTAIAAELHLPHVTVRHIWRTYRDGGDDALAPRYHACGSATPTHPQAVAHEACGLKRHHPTWGAGRIRLELLGQFPPEQVPSPRVLQRAFQQAGVHRPRRLHRPRLPLIRAQVPHEVWQVDAVEKAQLATGAEVSWLTVTDEYSGAWLAAELSPPAQWQSITPDDR